METVAFKGEKSKSIFNKIIHHHTHFFLIISSVSLSPIKMQRPRQYTRSQVKHTCFCFCCIEYLTNIYNQLETILLQSVYSRDVDDDESFEAEEALRERDERIRELETVIMRQVGSNSLIQVYMIPSFVDKKAFLAICCYILYDQAEDMAEMKLMLEKVPMTANNGSTSEEP